MTVAGALSMIVALAALAVALWLALAPRGDMAALRDRLDALEQQSGTPNGMPSAPIIEGLPIGVPAPTFALPDLHGKTVTLSALRAARLPVLLLFWKPESAACMDLLPEIGHWQRDHAAAVTVALICCSPVEESRSLLAVEEMTHVLFQGEREIAQAYHVWATPSAVLVHAGGVIGSPLAVGADAVRDLATNVLGIPARRRATSPVTRPFWQRGGRPRKSHYVADELLSDGSMVLYHAWRQKIMTLNPTGALIWECCDGEHDLAMIVREVRDVFPDAPDIKGDVASLLQQLFENRMIDPVRT